jgi:hypothetical protein
MILTPKEKAKELVNRFAKLPEEGTLAWYLSFELSKQCALIAVDEMMEVYVSACVAMGMSKEDAEKKQSKYLQEVKKEIELL